MDIQEKKLHECLREAMARKGESIAGIARLTGIQQGHLEALMEGRYDSLPPLPYIRGYLTRIGPIIGVETDELVRLLHETGALRASGTHDMLPINRFALQKIRRRTMVFGIFALLLLGYITIRFDALTGKPPLQVESPRTTTAIVAAPQFEVRGIADSSDKLTINGEEVTIGANGNFTKTISLQQGINTVHIITRRFLGRTTEEIRQIIYNPKESPAVEREPAPF